MDFFNTSFYDTASVDYSKKRYGSAPESFIQFFFQQRLRHVLTLIGKHTQGKKDLTLIEDGCADGVVVQAIAKMYSNTFSQMIGTDISPGMIGVAQKQNTNTRISFSLKDSVNEDVKADFLLAVGFVSPGIFENEFAFMKKHLARDGIVIVSLASNNSPYALLKLKDKDITRDYWNFKKYRAHLLERDFEVLDSIPYGLFIPKLWAFPRVARVVQPILETLLNFYPTLFHETLYVLKYRR